MKNKNNIEFCVSLTTIPPRFINIEKTLYSILDQTLKPNKIFLNVPINYKRFAYHNADLDYLEKKFDLVKIIYCEDYGPGTKLLGALKYLNNYDYVILVDDDHKYHKFMFQIFNQKYIENSNQTYSFCVYQIEDCKIGQGADGFLIKSSFLTGIMNFFNFYVRNNDKLLFNDDLWISIFINKFLGKDIVNLFPSFNDRFFFNKKSIYKKHITIGALIETYDFNKKKARKLKYLENCKEYIKLKSISDNFTTFKS